LDPIERVYHSSVTVVDPNIDHLSVEDVAYLIADQVEDRLYIELRGQALLHAVNDRQLGVALLQVGGALGYPALQLAVGPQGLFIDRGVLRRGGGRAGGQRQRAGAAQRGGQACHRFEIARLGRVVANGVVAGRAAQPQLIRGERVGGRSTGQRGQRRA